MIHPLTDKEKLVPPAAVSKHAMADNRFSIQLIVIAFVFSGAVLAWLSWSTYGLYTHESIANAQVSHAEELRGDLAHLDEALTMSARMAAATGEAQWEARYRSFEPQLDKAITEMVKLTPSQALAQTNTANIRLVEMEDRAFRLVRENKTAEARAILSSQQYEMQKRIYAQGITSVFEEFQVQLDATQRSQRKKAIFAAGADIAVLAVLLISWLAIIRRMYKAHEVLLTNVTSRKDTEEVLRKAQHELEVRVQERTSELTIANSSLTEQINERARVEAALRDSEESYRDLFENARDIIYTHDLEGNYTSVNKACETITGYTREETLGMSFSEVVSPSYLAEVTDRISSRPTNNSDSAYELEIMAKDGSGVILEVSSRLICEAGKPTAVQGIARDITERKRVEERLRVSEEKYRTILERIQDGYFEVDLAGNYIFVNESFCRISGRSADELMGASYKNFFDPEPAQLLYDTYNDIFKTGEPLRGFEYEVTRRDGTKVFVEESVSLKRNAAGHRIGFMGIRRDCTERKQIEAQLVEARDAALEATRLKSEFLANMSHEIRTPMNGVIGMTGLLLETNLTDEQKEFTETINSSADSLMTVINDILDFSKIEAGKLRFEMMDFDLLREVESPVELLAERAQVKGIEIASLIEGDVPLALRGDAGRLRQVITNLIGNAVKFTEVGEVVLRVSQVSSGATHAVLRFAISDTGVGISEEAQRRLFRAFVQADGSTTRRYGGTGLGLAISKQLVELMGGEIGIESKVGEGSTFWFTARFEKQLTGPAGYTKANLLGIRVLIVDDNERNRRVLEHQTNSLGMLSTCASNGAEALLVLRAEAAAGRPFSLTILDMQMPEMDGMMLAQKIKSDAAISSTRLLMLTSLGKRDDWETLRRAGIARCLGKPVKQAQLFDTLTLIMGDEIDGPTLSIPDQTTRPRPTATLSEPATQKGTINPIRILVAEDNLVNQKVALNQLQNLGYAPDVVMNGREALEALTRVPYPIVLMDCQMPVMDGYEATAAIRSREEGLPRRTVIIAMTAHALEGEREKCLDAGMDDYLSKPVKSDVLCRKLEQWTKSTGKSSTCQPGEANVVVDVSTASAIDFSVLEGLREIQQPGKSDLVTELIDLFLDDTSVQLKTLREAVSNKNAKEVRRVAHLLKGSSANIGAGRMAALYDSLEKTQSRNGELSSLMVKLDHEFERVNITLRAERRPGN